MKKVLFLTLVMIANITSAQIMRTDTPRSGQTPSRGSNYNDNTSVGQAQRSAPKPSTRQQSNSTTRQGRGCNFSCKEKGLVDKTPTGIPLDTNWKIKLNTFAIENVKHAAWGYSHSERNYHNTIKLAESEGLQIDVDVLLAASFLHDLGGLAKFEISGVDHGVRSAQLAEKLLRSFGFPEEKIASVNEVIIGHVYHQPRPESDLALAFRDADILDFLGVLGVARLLSATNELKPSEIGSIDYSLSVAKKMEDTLFKKLTFETSKKIAKRKISESDLLFKILKKDSLGGLAY